MREIERSEIEETRNERRRKIRGRGKLTRISKLRRRRRDSDSVYNREIPIFSKSDGGMVCTHHHRSQRKNSERERERERVSLPTLILIGPHQKLTAG